MLSLIRSKGSATAATAGDGEAADAVLTSAIVSVTNVLTVECAMVRGKG